MGQRGRKNIFLLIALLASGCATSDAVREYPRRQVDRPYTLPDHLSIWKTVSVLALSSESSQSASKVIGFPFLWENAVSPGFTLEWSPLPTGFRYLIQRYDSGWLGVAFNLLGSPLYQFQDFNFTPIVQLDFRKKLTSSFALNGTVSTQLELRRSSQPFHLIAANRLGGLCQLTDSVAIEPYFSLNWEIGNPRTGYFVSPSSTASSGFRVPIGFRMTWFPLEQWEVSADYRYFRLNYPNDYQSHQFFLATYHYF